MRPYAAVVSARFRALLQYRAAAFAGLVTQIFWGAVRLMILEAFARSSVGGAPMDAGQIASYVWLGQALLALFPWSLDGDVVQMVRSGAVAYELLRPMDLYWLWYARALAQRTAPTVLRAAPLLLLAWAAMGLRPPSDAAHLTAFAISTLGALVLSCAMSALLSVSLIYTISGEGVARLLPIAAYFLSGMVLPLPFMPTWAQRIADLAPFSGLVDHPHRLYTGHIPVEQAPLVLLHQVLWSAIIIVLGRWLMACGLRRMVVQGG